MTEKLLQELENKLKEMEIEGHDFQKKIRALIHKRVQPQVLKPISYFNFSTIIEKEHTIIGSFHFHNQTALPLHNPIILLKINSDKPYDFSGKYLVPKKQLQNDALFWERIENRQSQSINEYSFKPVSEKIIRPNETFTFSSLQIRVPNEESGYLQVEGFIYCQEISEGIASLNSISISY